MKTNLLRTSLAAVLAAAAAYAQAPSPLQANVPFDFIIGNQTLRAGQYRVDQVKVPGAVVITCSDCKGTAIALGPALHSFISRNEARLVFHRYGDTYFLVEVWGPDQDGRQIPRSRQEQELTARAARPVTILAALR